MKKELRLQVYNKYNGHCAYCGKEIAYKEMQVDHIRPRLVYQDKLPKEELDSLDNYNPSCRMCNFRKDTLSVEAFREEIRLQAERSMRTFQNRMSAAYNLIIYHPEKKVEFYFEKYMKD